MYLLLSIGLTSHNYINNNLYILFNIFNILYVLTLWFKDIIAENSYLGNHTIKVKKGLILGFYLFVISEIFIFISLFWAFLHSSLNSNIEIGMVWPPIGLNIISANELPLLNTIILLASGITITFGHHSLINGNRSKTLIGFIITTLLIILFVIFQSLEYFYSEFTLTDGIYGSTFYSLTGLHGIHMIMLIIMLSVCSFRIYNYNFTNNSHIFGESTILYLHILDILWLFIYIIAYWWGS